MDTGRGNRSKEDLRHLSVSLVLMFSGDHVAFTGSVVAIQHLSLLTWNFVLLLP